MAITDRFNLTGGLRWYDFDEHRIQTFDGIFADAGTNRGDTGARGVAPRLIASYDATDATHVNAQVSKGFRLGGINDPLNVPICTPRDLQTFGNRDTWEDEELWNYEAGVKSTFLGGQGTLNFSGFYMDIRNLQATVTAGSCSSRIIFNVPESRSAGMELEIAAQPTPLFDFAIAASVADGRLQSTLESYDTDGNSTGIIAGIEAGKRLPTTPLFQTTAAATWRWLMGRWVGYLSGTFQHVGPRFTQIGDQAEGFGAVNLLALANTIGGPLTQDTFRFDPQLPAYNLLNVRIGVLTGAWERRLLHQQRHRRAGVPGTRPGARNPRPVGLPNQPAAALRHRHALRLLTVPDGREALRQAVTHETVRIVEERNPRHAALWHCRSASLTR